MHCTARYLDNLKDIHGCAFGLKETCCVKSPACLLDLGIIKSKGHGFEIEMGDCHQFFLRETLARFLLRCIE